MNGANSRLRTVRGNSVLECSEKPLEPGAFEPHRLPTGVLLAVLLFPVPVVLVAAQGVELAPIDVAGPLLLAIAAIRAPRLGGERQRYLGAAFSLVLLSMSLASASMLWVALSSPPLRGSVIEQLASMAFTFRPLLFLFAGVVVSAWCGASAGQILKPIGICAAISCSLVAAHLIVTGVPHHQWGSVEYGGRSEFGEHLAGQYLWLPLYGRYGVNSLAETYAVYCALALAAGFLVLREFRAVADTRRLVYLIILGTGFTSGVFLCVTSGSRQAISLVALLIALPLLSVLARRMLGASPAGVGVIVLLGVLVMGGVALQEIQSLSQQGRLEDFAAGRIGILEYNVSRVWQNPFTGSGFIVDPNARIESNAHNLVLNLTRKMGIPAAMAFLGVLIFVTVPPLTRLVRGVDAPEVAVVTLAWVLLVGVVGLVSNSLDVVPASGPLLFLLGVFAAPAACGAANERHARASS